MLESSNDQQRNLQFQFIIGWFASLGLCPMLAYAAVPIQPDIGAIVQSPTPVTSLHIQEDNRALVRPEKTPSSIKDTDAQQGSITVQSIQFKHDLQFISDAELQQFIQPYIQKYYRLSEFKTFVTALEQWLRQDKGLVKAQVWIPLQEIVNGVVQLNITQGSFVDHQISENVSADKAEKIRLISQQYLQKGQAITQKNLEEVAYRVMDYTGNFTQIVLMPTSQVGHYTVLFDVFDQNKITGQVSLDNTGNRYTSRFRDNSVVVIHDATGLSDKLTVSAQLLNKYQHSLNARYELPTVTGWKLGVEGQYADYELCCEFKDLEAKGDVIQLSADALYPLARSRELSLWVGGKAKYWNGSSEQLGIDTLDRELKSVSFLSNIAWSDWANHYAKFELTGGNATLNNTTDELLDKATSKIAGSYFKLDTQYFLNYPLNERGVLAMNAQAQWANKNLESSEKISMGGLSAIRAYPYGEGMGDLGAVAQLEYRHSLLPHVQGAAFYDLGYVRLDAKPWQTGIKNQYYLHGLGASVTWQPIQPARLQLIGATKLGKNAGEDFEGRDSDGKDSRVRAWLVGSWSF